MNLYGYSNYQISLVHAYKLQLPAVHYIYIARYCYLYMHFYYM